MGYDTVRLAAADNVATVTLNRPERLNACSLEMAGELSRALDEAIDGGARAIILTGEGRAFCSGADLAARGDGVGAGSGGKPGDGSYAALTGHYNPLVEKLVALPVPVVSAVNGAAAGVGCSIALAADFVLAGASGYFLQAFVNIGLVPDGGASWMLPRLIGKARATEMMMLGEKVDAAKAQQWGLIYKAVADGALMNEANTLATRLASGPTVALGTMKANIAAGLDLRYTEALHREALGQRTAGNSQDAIEGGMAFLQKRKANFTGK